MCARWVWLLCKLCISVTQYNFRALSSMNASSSSSSETTIYLASGRQTNALPVSPSGMGLRMGCSTFKTVLFDAFGTASVKIRPDSNASTCVINCLVARKNVLNRHGE